MAEGKVQIFFSNSHLHNKDMEKISDYLTKNGYKCWLAKKNIPGKGLSTMERVKVVDKAIDDSSIVIVGYSNPYRKSAACYKEFIYAESKNKYIIPIKLQREYKPDGWLGLRVAAYTRLDNTNSTLFEKTMTKLLEIIKNQPKEERYNLGTGTLTMY